MDREPTDRRELLLVRELYRLAETLPLEVALMVLMSAITLLIRGSGHSTELWDILAEGVEIQRQAAPDCVATHPPPSRMQ